ncbi:unnamed protein product [Moneuplotes crassus]|uniref:Cyclin-like domain-containing protein n=1 Tax=Euplotes crassus TaxID=5936 RepID=A0AAD1UD64_EUPCR|nr:unnamed protein product [Moneuplotes crassus]
MAVSYRGSNVYRKQGSLMEKLKKYRRGMIFDQMNYDETRYCVKKRELKYARKNGNDNQNLYRRETKKLVNPKMNHSKTMSTLQKLMAGRSKINVDSKTNISRRVEKPLISKNINAPTRELKRKKTCTTEVIEIFSEELVVKGTQIKREIKKDDTADTIKSSTSLKKTEEGLSLSPNVRLCKDYGKRIVENLHKEDQTLRLSKFLDKHKEFTPRVRARMVDWFVEIVCNFGCSMNTFYLAVRIMDQYFNAYKGHLSLRNLHLIGVTSIFIASKMEDIVPFSLRIIHEKIAHQNLSKGSILNREKEIFDTLYFNVNFPTVSNFTNIFLVHVFEGEGHEDYPAAYQLVDYVSKITQYEYSVVTGSQSILSGAILYLSFTILQKIINKKCINKSFMRELVSFFNIRENSILSVAKDLLCLIQNFDSRHQGLNNMKSVQFKSLSRFIK